MQQCHPFPLCSSHAGLPLAPPRVSVSSSYPLPGLPSQEALAGDLLVIQPGCCLSDPWTLGPSVLGFLDSSLTTLPGVDMPAYLPCGLEPSERVPSPGVGLSAQYCFPESWALLVSKDSVFAHGEQSYTRSCLWRKFSEESDRGH